MRSHLMYLFALATVVACTGNEQDEENNLHEVDPIQQAMDLNADSLLAEGAVNALAIGVIKDGNIHMGYYGELDQGKNNPPTHETLFEIGSVTKTFTGTVAAYAVEEGKIELDQPVTAYLPKNYSNLAFNEHPVTIRHLLTHTSGLPGFLPDSLNDINPSVDTSWRQHFNEGLATYTQADFLADLHQVKLDTIPGFLYRYSNAGANLMAYILEEVYGKTYDELLAVYITGPLKMTATQITLSADEKKRLANGYDGEGNGVEPWHTNLWGADGELKSTLPDLMTYMQFHLDPTEHIAQKSHERIFSHNEFKLGYFWNIGEDEPDGVYFGHHGGTGGMQNVFYLFPKHNTGISVIVNQSDTDTPPVLFRVVNNLLTVLR